MKGQVTLFIIIGIVILVGMGVVVFVFDDEVEVQQIPQFEQTRTSLDSYVDGCLDLIVPEALEIMRMQGGFIQIPSSVKTHEVQSSQTITGSVVKSLEVREGFVSVPYWYDANGVHIPTLELMQNQFSDQIKRKLEICVNDFEPFQNEGFTIEVGEIQPTTIFRSSVVVDIDFPVKMTRGDEILQKDIFTYSLPINMETLWDYGQNLVKYEDVLFFLEEHEKKIISLYALASKDKQEYSLPPFSLTVPMDCNGQQWTKSEVKKKLQELYEINFPYIKIGGTDFERVVRSEPIEQGVYDSFIHPYFSPNNNIEINFTYKQDFDLNRFDVSPSKGGSLEADTFSAGGIPGLGLYCHSRYAFKYTTRTPILVRITDKITDLTELPVGVNEKDFVFQFFMETDLCGNQPRECVPFPEEFGEVTQEVEQIISETFFCEQESSGILTFTVQDGTDFVDNARLTYYCGNERNNCFLGRTNDGVLSTQTGMCTNGRLIVEREGYVPLEFPLSVVDKNNYEIPIQLNKLTNKSVNVKLIHLPTFVKQYYTTNGYTRNDCFNTTPEEAFLSSVHDLFAKDKVLLSFEGQTLQPPISYPDQTEMFFIPGEYIIGTNYIGVMTVEDAEVEGQQIRGMKESPQQLGYFDYHYSLQHQLFDEITFFAPAEHLPSEEISILEIGERIYDSDTGQLHSEVRVDWNEDFRYSCNYTTIEDGQLTKVNRDIPVTIEKYVYIPFFEPELK